MWCPTEPRPALLPLSLSLYFFLGLGPFCLQNSLAQLLPSSPAQCPFKPSLALHVSQFPPHFLPLRRPQLCIPWNSENRENRAAPPRRFIFILHHNCMVFSLSSSSIIASLFYSLPIPHLFFFSHQFQHKNMRIRATIRVRIEPLHLLLPRHGCYSPILSRPSIINLQCIGYKCEWMQSIGEENRFWVSFSGGGRKNEKGSSSGSLA